MGLLKEFKEFAMKGSFIDMAVGIIIGAATGKVVNTLVEKVINPPLGLLLGNDTFTSLSFTLHAAADDKPAVVLQYGAFISSLIDFFILAFIIFLVIKQINRFRAGPPTAPTTKECPKCCSTISIKATRCPHCTSEIGG